MAKTENESQPLMEQLENLIAELGNSVAEGVVKGLEESQLLNRLVDGLQSFQKRLDDLEGEVKRLRNELPQCKKLQALPVSTTAALGPPPVSWSASKRTRSRITSRPTVSYRTDPRAASLPSKNTCSEPGCDRAARSRGMCSLHYQRFRYRERKIEHKQSVVEALPPPPPPTVHRPANFHRRNGGTRGIFSLLYEEKGRKVLAGLINQMKFDRSDLVQRLNVLYRGMPGVPLDEEDVLRSIHYHRLGDALRKREAEILCRHLSKLGGSLTKTAQKMKMDLRKLKLRIEELNIEGETTRIRNEFREEIIENYSFNQQLDLALTKEKYLEDLGIEQEVDELLRRELASQVGRLTNSLDQVKQQSLNDEAAGTFICHALSLDQERYLRLLKRLRLEPTLESLCTNSTAPGVP